MVEIAQLQAGFKASKEAHEIIIQEGIDFIAKSFLTKKNLPSPKKAKGALRFWERLQSTLQRNGESDNLAALNQSFEVYFPGFIETAISIKERKKQLRQAKKAEKDLARWQRYEQNKDWAEAVLETIRPDIQTKEEIDLAIKQFGEHIPPELIRARLSNGKYSPRNQVYKAMFDHFGIEYNRPKKLISQQQDKQAQEYAKKAEEAAKLESENTSLKEALKTTGDQVAVMTEANLRLAVENLKLKQDLQKANADIAGLYRELGVLTIAEERLRQVVLFHQGKGPLHDIVGSLMRGMNNPGFKGVEFIPTA